MSICRCQNVKNFTAAQARNSFIMQAALGNKLETLERFDVPEIIGQVIILL